MAIGLDDAAQRLLQKPGAELTLRVTSVACEPSDQHCSDLLEADEAAASTSRQARQMRDADLGHHKERSRAVARYPQ